MYIPMKIRLLLTLLAASLTAAAQQPADYVNPIIGTNGMGHTFPGACTPFGLVQLSPDTDTIPHNVGGRYQGKAYEYCAGYQYSDPTIVGFSHTHLSGTGHSDLGDILLMPTTGPLKLTPGRASSPDEGYRSRYSHDTEKATPGYYEVTLADYGIRVQLTATQRAGIHRYTFPQGEEGHLILDLTHGIYNYDGKVLWANLRVENDTLLTGYRITNGWARTNYTYFAISFSQPIREYGYRDLEPVKYNGFWRRFHLEKNFPEITGRKIVSYLRFDTSRQSELVVRVALSAVSTEGALKNLRAEASDKSFDQLAQEARESWNNELRHFTVEGTPDQKTMFYTSLYHTMINPSVYMDVDGQYRGLDHNIHHAQGFTNYTIFSLWDTYRALHPFLNLMKPERNADMVQSMLEHARQSVHGMLPVWSLMGNENWCMSGYHGVSAVADALVKDVWKGNTADALHALATTSTVPYYEGVADYMKLGYIPLEKSGTAASSTLEYAYDDFTIYRAALKAGNTEMAETYRRRALNYRHLYDPSIGFARPRLADGSFKPEFDVLQTYGEGFIEGNSWNFSFHVPHDVFGLMTAMGGERSFLEKLDQLFSMHLPEKYYEHNEDITEECLVGGYVHGNEPSHHVPYLYAWTSQPWKTQYWLREILNKMYRNDINGLGGNDDCGQMSAWYLFSVMGFYPVCPGTDQYVLGAPYLPYLKLELPNGKTLEIKAPGVSDRKRYVQSLRINGQEYDKTYVTHDDLLQGGVWEFKMSASPNKRRGTAPDTKPYSLTGTGE
ncbi:MAG: GH92 family glycosyl hydrolase [Bacteroides sp.]|nr:GH92 family glycosyl hydrolase [Bacteroides sp.]